MFKSHLAVLIAQKDITQDQLYKDSGIMKSRIKKLKESKIKYLTLKEMETLSNYFDCTLNDILTHEKQQDK